ncbi:MAG TPA: hypothetical protein VJ652_10795 [Noviherbaspirillum sp.]|nr:hypothetical protein [Noviherbaspirillum sp.]
MSLFVCGKAEVAIRVRVIRLERQCVQKACHCLSHFSLVFQCDSKVVMRIDMAGIERHRLPETGNRFFQVVSGLLDQSQIVVHCRSRLQRDRLPDHFEGNIVIASLMRN